MKLHLPSKLRAALLACMAVAASFGTTIATGTITGGALVATLAVSQQAQAATVTGAGTKDDPYVITSSSDAVSLVSGTVDDAEVTYGEDQYIEVNVTGGYLPNSDDTIVAHVVIDNLQLNNVNKNRTYTFKNTVSGTGTFSFSTASTGGGQAWDFQNDVSGFTGVINISGNGSYLEELKFTGGGEINATSINVADTLSIGNTTGRTDAEGVALTTTVNTGTVTAGTLNINGTTATTFNGAVTATTTNIASGASAVFSVASTDASSGASATLSDTSGTTTSTLGALTMGAGSSLSVSSGASVTASTSSTLAGTVSLDGTLTLGGTVTLAQGLQINGTGTLGLSDSSQIVVDSASLAHGTVTEQKDGDGNVTGWTVSVDNYLSIQGGVQLSTETANALQTAGLAAGTENSWNFSTTVAVNGWDANWGVRGLVGAPNTSTLPAFSDVSDTLTAVSDGTDNSLFLSKSTNEQVSNSEYTAICIDAAVPNPRQLYGGEKWTSFGSAEAPKDSWILVTGGSNAALRVVGGSATNNDVAACSFYGDSHILMSGGTIHSLIGGNFRSTNRGESLFDGSSFISVTGGEVKGYVIGAGTLRDHGTNTISGDTNIFIYSCLSSNAEGSNETTWLDPASSAVNPASSAAVIGGGAQAGKGDGLLSILGDTNILIDTTDKGDGSFVKKVIGGSFLNGADNGTATASHSGSTNITIEADSGQTFTQEIVGGSYSGSGAGDAVHHIGDVNITLTGGTYSTAVVGGSYANATGAITHDGAINVTLNGGTYNGYVILGGYLGVGSGKMTNNAASTLTVTDGTFEKAIIGGIREGSLASIVQSNGITLDLQGGTFSQAIVGGHNITGTANTDLNTFRTGDISVTLGGGSGTATANGPIFGGSVLLRGSVTPFVAHAGWRQGAIEVVINSGANISGDIYAGGGAYNIEADTPSATTSNVKLISDSTTVRINSGATIGEGITISGGYLGLANGVVTGDRTLIIEGGSLDLTGRTLADFDKISLVGESATLTVNKLNLSGTLTFDGATLSLASDLALSIGDDMSLYDMADPVVSDGVLTEKYTIITVGDAGDLTSAVASWDAGYTFDEASNTLYFERSAEINGWDQNWGVEGLEGAPAVADLTDSTALAFGVVAKDESSKVTCAFVGESDTWTSDGTAAIKLTGSATEENAYVVGGKNGAEATLNTWIYIDSAAGTWGTIVGGNFANNYDTGANNNFTGDSHILMEGGTVDNIIGGNFRDGNLATFTGDSYITVATGNVNGFIVGAGTSAHASNSKFVGDTHIWVNTLLGTPDTNLKLDNAAQSNSALTAEYAAVAGGGATARNGGTINVEGKTSVTVDLGGGTGSGEFQKYVVGGSVGSVGTIIHADNTAVDVISREGVTFTKDIAGGTLRIGCSTVSHSNTTSVAVSSSGASTFSGAIVGGSIVRAGGELASISHAGNTSVVIDAGGSEFNNAIVGGIFSDVYYQVVNHTGDSQVQIDSGIFNDVVIAGTSVRNWTDTALSGLASLEINGGTFNKRIIGAARVVSDGTLTSSIANNSTDTNVSMSINGGTINGGVDTGVIGGFYLTDTGDKKSYALKGDIELSFGGSGSGPTVNANIYGGSYIGNASAVTVAEDGTGTVLTSTTTQKNISVNLGTGSKINGSVYAAGALGDSTKNGTITTESTRVEIASGVTFNGTAQVISGGYENATATTTVTGDRTLATTGTGTVDLSGNNITLQDFTVANVADDSTLNIGSKLADSGITQKTGAGTLIISGANATSLTVNAGTLQAGADTSLTGLTFADNTTLKLTSFDDAALSLEALTLEGRLNLDVTALTSASGQHTLATVTGDKPMDLSAIALTGAEDGQLGWQGNELVLTLASTTGDLYWIGGEGHNVWTPSDTDSFSDTAAGTAGSSPFSNGDNVTFATAATPTLEGNLIVGTLTANAAVSLNVGTTPASLTVDSLALGASGSLAKTGEGTLTVSENIISNDTTTFDLQGGTLAIGGELDGTKTYNISSAAGSTLSLAFSDNTANTLDFTSGNTLAGTTAITDGYVSMDKVARLDIAEGATVKLTNYNNSTAMNLTGSGTMEIEISTASGGSQNTKNSITYDASNWTGKVVLYGEGTGFAFANDNFRYGNANSTIEFKGLKGYAQSSGTSINSSVIFTNPGTETNNYAWWWDNTHASTTTFTGSVSGSGELHVDLSGDISSGSALVFTGNVSAFDGKISFLPSKNTPNADRRQNYIEFSGSATEVNASIEVDAKDGRAVWLQFTNDQDVAMNGSIKDNVTSGNTGTLSLHKSGTGTLTLTGENTYSGGTYIAGGTLVVNQTSLSQNTSLVLSDGTTFQFANNGSDVYTLDNTISMADGATTGATLDFTAGQIDLASDLSGFTGTINMAEGAGLTLHEGLSGAQLLTGAGNVTIDSPDQEVAWTGTGKNYSGTTTITGGTTVRAEGGLSTGNTAVTLGDGARLILADITDQGSTASANSGFGSINTGTSGTVVITTNDAFSAGKWIVGAGTIEVDIDLSTGTGSKGVEDIRLTAEGFVNNAIPNAGEATSAGLSRFSGTYLLTSGQLYLDGQRNGKLAQGVSPTPTVRIMEDGQLWVAERDGGNWTFNIDLAAASSEAIGSVTGQQAGLVLGINGTTEALFTGSLTLAAGTAISSTQGYSKFSGSAVINGDASIDIASGSAVTLAGVTDLNAHTLTKTGEGKLQLGSNSNITNWDTAGSTLDVQAGTLALHLAGSTGSATWNGTIRVADGAKVYRDQGTVTLSALEVADTGTVTLAARTNQTWNLASVEGGATIRLTRENAQGADYNATATNATLISLTGQNDNFTGTWDVASFITLQLADAAAAEQAAIHLTYASGTSKKAQLTVSSQEETYLIRELSGVTGTQVNAGKYNVAAGGTFSGTLASGVELTVSGGDMDLSGAALSAGNISIIGSSTDATISNLSLGSGVTLSSSLSTAETPAPTVGIRNLTLAGGTLKFAMNGTDEADTYVPVPRFDAGGTDLSVTSGTVTTLMLDPGPEAASIAQGTYTLISNIGSGTQLADLLDSVRLNYSNEGRTQYTLSLGENSLQLLVQGGSAATLTWQGGSADTWDTDQGNLCWDNSGADDCFYSYDNVIFGTQSGADGAPIASTVSIAESGVTAGTITVVGASDYTFQGGGISSATDSAGLTVGTADSPFTGTLRIETANSWLGDTTINSGTVVAADTAALSDTTATVNAGGALVVDLAGEADRLDAAVILKGGTLAAGDTAASTTVENLGITAEGATLDGTANTLNVALGSISEDASITTLGTVSLTATEAKTLAGLTVGVEGEGAQTSDLTITTGTSLTSDATVNTGSTLTVAGTLTAGNITGAGTLTVGETLEGSLTYSGKTLEVDTVVLNNATLTSTAEGGTTVSGAVTAGSRQGINKLAAFEGTWKLDNLQENAYIQVGTGSNELQQGHLTANRADGAAIEVFGEGSSLTVTEKSAIQSVQADSGNEVTLADGTSVETLHLAATLTGTKAVLASDGTLTVNELGLIGTDASAVGTLIVTGDSSISTDSSAGAIVVDGQAASLALSASSIGDLTISQGVVTVGDATATASSVTLNGTGATLDLSGGMLADTITMQAGSLANAGSYTGTVDVTGASGTLAMGGLTGDATLNLAVAGATLQLTELTGVTLGNSSISLSDAMKGLADDAALLQLDAPASVAIASGATVTINVNDVLAGLLGTELNADTPSVSASYTIGNGNADLNTLDGSVTFDAALAVMNITADFTEDGQLVLTRYGAQSEDAVYVATEDQGDGVETWAGNGKPNTYDSTEGYVAIVIDQDTTISLKGHETPTDQQGIGLNLPNLIGANGSTLTVQGDNTSTSTERDLVTINPNISVDELPDNVGNSLSYNGHINLEQTDLQLAATDAATGGQTPDTVYAVNGKLTADADSQVILTSGVLQLNGTGNTLGGGLTVAENGGVQANGDTTLSGTVSGAPANGDTGRSDITVSGGKELTLAGASLEGVSIAGESGSQMTVAAGETASAIDTASGVAGMLLHIEEGAKLTIRTAADASMRMRAVTTPSTGVLEYTGLTGSGELASEVEAAATLTLDVAAGDSYTFEGSMTGYNGTIILKGAGTQGFASDAGGTTFSVQGGNLVLGSGVASVKNLSLSGSEGSTGSATINLAGSDTSTNRTLTVNDTLSLTTGGTLNLTLNLTKSMLSGTGAIQTTGSTYDGGTVAITFAGVQSDLDLTGGESVSAVIVQGTEEAEGSKVTLTDTGDKLLQKYFGDTAALQVTGGNLVLSGTTVDATTASFHQDAASSKNGHTGAVMLDALYSTLNPQVNDPDSAAAAVLDELEQMILAGNTGAADRQMAAVSGASATAMGAAFAGDMQRQLMAIRNRTTTMGVGDSVVSHDLPYFNAWVNAEGNYRTMEQDGTLAGYEINSWGATAGFDADLTPKFTAGLALTAMYGDLTAKAAEMAEGDLDTYYVTAFARYAPSAWVHTFVASVGIADASLERTVGTGSGAYRTSGDTNGIGIGLMYEVGYTIPMNEEGTSALQPIANITYAHSSLDGYTETGSDMAVRYGDQTMDMLTIGLGLRAQTTVGENVYNRTSLLEGRVLAKFDLGDRSSSASAGLVALGRSAGEVESAEIGAVGLELGAGLTIPVGQDSGSLFLDGSLELRADYTNVNATVGYRVNF